MTAQDTLPPLADTALLARLARVATDAANHRASVCGEDDGRCRHRRANLAECDGLLDVWLERHGRP